MSPSVQRFPSVFSEMLLDSAQIRNRAVLKVDLTADLQREMLSLQREEQKLIQDIKKTAKQGNTAATKTLAKSLVRIRGQMNQLRASEAHLRGVKYAVTVRLPPAV